MAARDSPEYLVDDHRLDLAGSRRQRPALHHRVTGNPAGADSGGPDRRRRGLATVQGHDPANARADDRRGGWYFTGQFAQDLRYRLDHDPGWSLSVIRNLGRHDVPGNLCALPVRIRSRHRSPPKRGRFCGIDLLFEPHAEEHLMGRVLRNVSLLILAAVWILPLYLILINAAKSPEGYRETERYAPAGDS